MCCFPPADEDEDEEEFAVNSEVVKFERSRVRLPLDPDQGDLRRTVKVDRLLSLW